MIVGIDIHKHSHTAALLDERGGELGTLCFADTRDGVQRLRRWLLEHEAGDAVIGVENAAGCGRLVCAALTSAGHEVRNVPAWRTHRDRHTSGPGTSDPGDALAIAHVVLRKREQLGGALEPELIRAIALLETLRRQFVGDRTQAIQRLRAIWTHVDPEAEARVVHVHRNKVLRRLKRITLGQGPAAEAAARSLRELAGEIERLNTRVGALESDLAALLDQHGNPLAGLPGAGPAVAAAVIAHAGECAASAARPHSRVSAAPPRSPAAPGQTAERHRLHRGGNRQMNAALHRIAVVQARVHPAARPYLERRAAKARPPAKHAARSSATSPTSSTAPYRPGPNTRCPTHPLDIGESSGWSVAATSPPSRSLWSSQNRRSHY